MPFKTIRSPTWLSKLLKSSFGNFSSPSKEIPKLPNKLMYNNIPKRPLLKMSLSFTNRRSKLDVGGNKPMQTGTVNNRPKDLVNSKLKERKNKVIVADNKQQQLLSSQGKWENSRPVTSKRKNLANTRRIKAQPLKHSIPDNYDDNKHSRWSPYPKNKNHALKHHVTSATLPENAQENDHADEVDWNVSSNTSTNLGNRNDNRTWILDVYKKKTSPTVDRLIKGHNISCLSRGERKRPVFVCQKPVFTIHKKATKTKNAISSLFLGEKISKHASKRFLSIREYRKNGDKCLVAPQPKPKTNEPDRTKLMRADDDHASRVIEVKVLNDPDGKVKENMQQEWLVLPNDVQDEWKAYQDLKSQSQLTENNSFSNQTPADQNSKPSTELINHMEHKQNAKEHICNVFSASSPADPSVIELMQSPSHDPTSVKIITDNYHYNSVLETSTSCPNLSDRTEKRSRFHIRKAFSRGNLTSLFAELQARDLAEPKDQHLDQSNAQDLGLSLTESSELPEDMKDKTKNTTTEAFEESSQNKSVLGEVVNRSNLTSLFADLQARDLTESKDQDLAQSNAEDLGLSLTEASEVPEDMTDKTNNTTTEDVEESNQNKSVLAVVIKNDLPKKTLTNTLVKIPFKRDEEGRWTKLAAESMNTQRQMSLKKISSNTHIDNIIHPPPSPINKTVVVLKPKEISKAIMGVSFADLTRKHQWQPTKVVY